MGIAAIGQPALSARQKAAVIVRLVLAEGEDIDLARLPSELQTDLDSWLDYYNKDRYQWDLLKLSPKEYYEYLVTGVYPLPMYMKD